MKEDIRWKQRFNNFRKANDQLRSAVELSKARDLSSLEEQGLIQAFEYTHELAWKTMKDFVVSKGNTNIYGSKDATREGFHLGLLEDGEGWMKMILSRNLSSHTYNEDTADQIVTDIIGLYSKLFDAFEKKMLNV